MIPILALLLAAATAGPACPAQGERPPICSLDWMFGTWSVANEDPTGQFGGPSDGGARSIQPASETWVEIRPADGEPGSDILFLGFHYDTFGWVSVSLDETGQAARAVAPNGAWASGRTVFEGQIADGGQLVEGRLIFDRRGADEFVLVTERRSGRRWEPAGIERFRRRGAR